MGLGKRIPSWVVASSTSQSDGKYISLSGLVEETIESVTLDIFTTMRLAENISRVLNWRPAE